MILIKVFLYSVESECMTISMKQLAKQIDLKNISRAQVRFAVLTLFCLVMVVYGYKNLLVAPLQAKMAATDQQIQHLELDIQRLPQVVGRADLQAKKVAALKDNIAAKQETLRSFQQQMATEQDIARVVKTLAVTAAPENFSLQVLRKKPAVEQEDYRVQPFEVGFQADYDRMADYLKTFSQVEKLYAISDVRIFSRREILPRVEVQLGINNFSFF
ncbi:MAG: type 4a pilus biogenesis protein PilO [Deltaproteobacteria bacterium]|nr:type 4a pilus biogenesis protein PilO [Candidatus Anaeroferrophillus wilburensis]MBN2889428.1 type 4a pilus biogenesis protein PilO [Deltaproteobacteria bacterium]